MKAAPRGVSGPGRLSDDLRAELSQEGFLVLEEGLQGSITYHHYRGPDLGGGWGASNGKQEPARGTIAVTHRRLVVWLDRHKHIDVPRSGQFRVSVQVSVPKPEHIRFSYDAARFRPERAGQVEVTLRTPNASRIDALLAPDPAIAAAGPSCAYCGTPVPSGNLCPHCGAPFRR